MRCSKCRFFVIGDSRPFEGRQLGECRKNPPKAGTSGFPSIYSDKWCGAFEPRKEKK